VSSSASCVIDLYRANVSRTRRAIHQRFRRRNGNASKRVFLSALYARVARISLFVSLYSRTVRRAKRTRVPLEGRAESENCPFARERHVELPTSSNIDSDESIRRLILIRFSSVLPSVSSARRKRANVVDLGETRRKLVSETVIKQ